MVQRNQDIHHLTKDLHAKDIKIKALTHELAYYRRIRFGAKTEAMSAEQLHLFEDDLAQDIAAIEAQLSPPADSQPRTRSRAGRQPLPDHLPREIHVHEPDSCTCAHCQGPLVKIGEDISEQLDVIPARFFVIRHIRPQYACRSCETITAAPVPPAIIDGGMAAPGLLAWVAVGKYVDHLPLYRLEQIARRSEVNLSRSTMSEWIGRMGIALQPLADRLSELLKQGAVLHADETPVQQLDPLAGKTRRAYLWAYRSNGMDSGPPIVVFDYQTSRSGQHAADFLSHWQGTLMVDDYGGYKALFREGVTELGCWAHARRKFFDLQAAGNHPVAGAALTRIARLYVAEEEARDMNTEARAQHRALHSLPQLQDMHQWFIELRPGVANGGALAKAIDYTLKRWPALIRYAETGHLPIDNNPVENAIRPIALGKKNWLFAGSERAGKRAAAIQSLFATARLNDIEPAAWLKDTLEKLPTWPNSRIDELLPIRQKA
ncbi:MAG: IS66 family transposase [Halothiobacillus sp. 13-55-253]|nr:MAG: IS66 family transposase [Halothiobacillus sp. 13-55-253]